MQAIPGPLPGSSQSVHEAMTVKSACSKKSCVCKIWCCTSESKTFRSLDDVQMTGGLLLDTFLSYQRNVKAKNLKKKPELALYDVSMIDSRECP